MGEYCNFFYYFYKFQTKSIFSLDTYFWLGWGYSDLSVDIAQEKRPLLDLTGLKPENVLKWHGSLIWLIQKKFKKQCSFC